MASAKRLVRPQVRPQVTVAHAQAIRPDLQTVNTGGAFEAPLITAYRRTRSKGGHHMVSQEPWETRR